MTWTLNRPTAVLFVLAVCTVSPSPQFEFAPAPVFAATNPFTPAEPNTPPLARADRYTTNVDQPLSIDAPGVLRNDVDADGEPLSAAMTTAPTNGLLTLNGDGSFTYTPNVRFRGLDGFTYHITDPSGVSATATVTFVVNTPPVASNDGYEANPDTTLTVPAASGVLSNDTDADGESLTATVPDASQPFLRVSSGVASSVDGCALLAQFDGECTHQTDPSCGLSSSALLKPRFMGVDWTAALPHGGAVTVVAAGPSNTGLTLYAVDEFGVPGVPMGATATCLTEQTQWSRGTFALAPGTQTFGVHAGGASAVDVAFFRISAIALVTPPQHGTVTLSVAGGFAYTPAAGFAGTDTFSYTASDGLSTSEAATVTIRVRRPTTMTLASSAAGLTPTYGTAVTLTAAATGSGTPASPGRVEFFDNGISLGLAAVDTTGTAKLTTTAIQTGTRSLTAVYGGTDSFRPSTSASLAQTINKATGTATFVTLTPLQKQYSDRVLMEATVSPATAADRVTFQIGTVILGTVPVINGKGSATLQMNAAPGSKIVTAVFSSANYSISNVARSMSILREDARVAYVGQSSLCLCGKASVPVTVQVSDITAIDPVADPDAGDIGRATVSFVNRTTLATLGSAIVTPTIDRKTGTATYNFPASALGTASSRTITFGFVVGGSYTRNSSADNVTVTITK